MALTAQNCIDQALAKIGVIAAGETPATEERTDALAVLNQMAASWSLIMQKNLAGSYGSAATFTPLPTYASLSDALGVVPGWERAYVANLAIELASEYGRPITPDLAATAAASKAAVVSLPAPLI